MNYQDYRQVLNQQLSDKAERELTIFCDDMAKKNPQEIFDIVYEIAMKKEIAVCFHDTNYTPQEAKALLKSPNLLDDIYQEWIESNLLGTEELRQTISDFKKYMVKTEKILSGKER